MTTGSQFVGLADGVEVGWPPVIFLFWHIIVVMEVLK